VLCLILTQVPNAVLSFICTHVSLALDTQTISINRPAVIQVNDTCVPVTQRDLQAKRGLGCVLLVTALRNISTLLR
jgi:hypothetical protein